jgi:hypothetical protein
LTASSPVEDGDTSHSAANDEAICYDAAHSQFCRLLCPHSMLYCLIAHARRGLPLLSAEASHFLPFKSKLSPSVVSFCYRRHLYYTKKPL